ncbi:translocation and assembly module lipoprotein TamL [Pontibacter harenae]|uniref:translocation and assembly module lipoprotein TamL n=1 Tax=Pontibacter harenae TaxID=2894083 RepID=UPI001E59A41E|nr:BamA/TamA family outer membrane protein [Pontibacter harenae]
MPTKHLAEDERLLLGVEPKGLEHVDQAAIEALYQQQPNRTVLGSTPYLSIYYFGKRFHDPAKIDERIEKQNARRARKIEEAGTDTARIRKLQTRFDDRIEDLQNTKEEGNFVMRLGEPPVIYDSTLMAETMDQIDIYMNSKGYFKHNATYEKNEHGKKLYIDIAIEENEPYRYTAIKYDVADSALLKLVTATPFSSYLQLGEIYDEQVLTQERDRLNEWVRNNGYYDFARAYIFFDILKKDSANAVEVTTVIQNPENSDSHKAYTLNNVYFKTDPDRFGIDRDTVHYNNLNFIAYNFRYSPKLLDKKVDIYPGQTYSQLRTFTTQRKLSELDVFQFNNVSYSKTENTADSTGLYHLDAFINAVPAKKFQETAEVGLTYSERQPGPFASVRLRVRNIFGGAENLDLGLRGGLEAQVSLTDQNEAVIIQEYGGDAALSFPMILVPFTKRNILSDYSPRTRIYTGFTNVDRQEYKRKDYDLSLSYLWQRSRRPLLPPIEQFIFSPINLTIAQVDTVSPEFARDLLRYSQGSRSLIESFRSGLISFMSFNYIYNTNDITQTRNAHYFRTLFEIGGLTEELGLNLQLRNLRTFQYTRINPEFRRYIPLGNRRYFVYRINTGFGAPLFNTQVLPYEKYFFAGGGTSVRAWRPRRLGPGSYATTDTLETGQVVRDYSPEQPGEILIEASAEYRFNMIGFLNGALFVDAGNVWLLDKDEARPGANFAFDRFYKEFAVGTGFGLRLDLSVVVLRFDLATKVYEPGGLRGEKFVLNNFKLGDFFRTSDQSSLNIGIGYPF